MTSLFLGLSISSGGTLAVFELRHFYSSRFLFRVAAATCLMTVCARVVRPAGALVIMLLFVLLICVQLWDAECMVEPALHPLLPKNTAVNRGY